MADVKIKFKDLIFDISYVLGGLETEIGLENAVLISLFTDARILEEELPKNEIIRGGWFGDAISDYANDRIGSKLWLLDRTSNLKDARNKAEQYAREALDWMIIDGVAQSITVKAFVSNRERIDLDINILKPNERATFFWRFQLFWEGQMMKVTRIY